MSDRESCSSSRGLPLNRYRVTGDPRHRYIPSVTRDLSTIDLLVLHHAKTPNGSSRYGAADVDKWHKEKDFRRGLQQVEVFQPQFRYIGYHGLILVSGELIHGRAENEIGAHAKGVNQRSLGICMMGTDKFTKAQWETLSKVVYAFRMVYMGEVIGHRDHNPEKRCPGFDVNAWLGPKQLPPELPPDGHLFVPPNSS